MHSVVSNQTSYVNDLAGGVIRLAESSFLLALFLRGGRNFKSADCEAARPAPIWVLSEVLGETLGVLQERKGIDFARLVTP